MAIRGFVLEVHAAVLGDGGACPLDRVPDETLAGWVAQGFEAVWLMGVWQRGRVARDWSLAQKGLRDGLDHVLPDWTEADVWGSPYAISDYRVDDRLGGPEALAGLRARMAEHGLKLYLDFVPNHLALDHAWAAEAPEVFVDGREVPHGDRWRTPEGRVLAKGGDRRTTVWGDVLQLDYRKPETRRRMMETLETIAEQCDGVRCDMAMLDVRDVFVDDRGGTWEGADFWPEAIARVKEARPDFLFIAEVYWDMEALLLSMGFDAVYDKQRLYDPIRDGDWAAVAERLLAPFPPREGCLVCLENHDEQRATEVFPDPGRRRAATALMAALPGIAMWHDGQIEGRRIHNMIHLARRAPEKADAEAVAFHRRLVAALGGTAREGGRGRVLPVDGPPSLQAVYWGDGDRHLVMVVNLDEDPAEGAVRIPCPGVGGRDWVLRDRWGDGDGHFSGTDLVMAGLPIAEPGHGIRVWEFAPA